ncbi:uncharacterized protein LTHEOB_2170 [Lasiodiplodia theobromae]|uniref:uncharacterized protein n=1 Tax=Lasiodiplodia theobromae TaxID=45133 RepID=UPI0015C2CBD9|nr:uncharacterized protein LTHEOB_2170 [Lasiodiplodia theobromae]KAF4536409.1 hypothetical protein LTHEOB_2170 [Lasiodiplodia theobromae]
MTTTPPDLEAARHHYQHYKEQHPTLRISTSLNPPTLSLSHPQPYPAITLTLTLTLHNARRPLTLSARPGSGGVLDPKKYSPRHAPLISLVCTRTGERPERSALVKSFAASSSSTSSSVSGKDITLDPRNDLVTIYPTHDDDRGGGISKGGGGYQQQQPPQQPTTLTRTFTISGYDDRPLAPVGPGERRVKAWWVAGSALSALRVDEGYEVELLPADEGGGGGGGGVAEWYEWGTVEEVVRQRVGSVGRAVGFTRFRAKQRWLGRVEEAGVGVGWEEGERAGLRLVG